MKNTTRIQMDVVSPAMRHLLNGNEGDAVATIIDGTATATEQAYAMALLIRGLKPVYADQLIAACGDLLS